MSGTSTGAASPFKQPKAVFAVAFACVGAVCGAGLAHVAQHMRMPRARASGEK